MTPARSTTSRCRKEYDRAVLALASLAAVIALAGCFSRPPAPSPDVTGDAGASDARGDALLDGTLAGHNIMFVSSGVFTFLPLQQGQDASFCSDAAQAAKLPGSYIGWLSHPTFGSAADRLRALPMARDWVRPDGVPFADTVDDIITGNILHPPVIDENRHDVTVADPNVQVATGTAANGTIDNAGAACSNGEIAVGKPGTAPAGTWTDSGMVNCSATNLRLYCFSFGG